jgi:hypothetical protein
MGATGRCNNCSQQKFFRSDDAACHDEAVRDANGRSTVREGVSHLLRTAVEVTGARSSRVVETLSSRVCADRCGTGSDPGH